MLLAVISSNKMVKMIKTNRIVFSYIIISALLSIFLISCKTTTKVQEVVVLQQPMKTLLILQVVLIPGIY